MITSTSTFTDSRHEATPASGLKVAYLMSRFPKITETFVLYEMLAVEQHGAEVEIYPLQRERTNVVHPEAVPLVERANFHPFLSWRFLYAHLFFLLRNPKNYLAALAVLLWANLGSLRYFAGAVAFFPKAVYFAYHMRSAGVHHIHAHFASHPAAVAFVIHRLTGIPYSFTAHGSDLHRDRHMLRQKVAEAALVVTISNYNKELIVSECGEQVRSKVEVIHCGIDTAVFDSADRTAGADGSGPLQIVCIGTLHEVKGQRYLIQACRVLRERGVDLICHLVGDGPDRADLAREASAADLTDVLQFHGRQPRGKIAELLGQAHVVAAPSVPTKDGRREGIPVALMEAMASGVPVVASKLSGIPELVEDDQNGLLVPPADHPALADALERLYNDPPLRHRLSRAARETVLAGFDLRDNSATLARRFARSAEQSCRLQPTNGHASPANGSQPRSTRC